VTNGGLLAGQAYEVIFYQLGQDPLRDGLGMAAPTTNTAIQIDLAGLDANPNLPLEPGVYLWGVRVVTQDTARPIGIAAAGRRFTFERIASSQPSPTVSFQPTPTGTPLPTPIP